MPRHLNPLLGHLLVMNEPQATGSSGGAPVDAQYVTLALDGTLTNERTLAVGTGLSLTDGGAGGNATIAPALDLAALEGLGTTGLAARTGTSTWATRTLTGPAAGITVSNGDGVSGNPTLALANDLAALEGLGTTGYARRTGADAWTLDTTATPSAHNLLSASHGDTSAASVVRGDLIVGNATPAWSRLAIGATNRVLRSNGTDASWAQVNLTTDVTGTLPVGNGGTGVTSLGTLTRFDDTNVTLTLGGTPTGALINAVSITAGWSGQLAIGRGGTGASTALGAFNALSPLTTRGDLLTRDASNNVRLAIGTANQVVVTNGTDPSWAKLLAANCGSTTGTGDVFVFQGSPTLTTPTIASFTNATHNHQNAAGGGTLDHGLALAGSLADDDHTQYLLLAGRTGTTNNPILSTSGDGTITGSSASGGDLYAKSTSHSTKGALRWDDPQVWWESIPAYAGGSETKRVAQFNPSLTMSPGGFDIYKLFGFAFEPTITASPAINSEVQGFAFSPTMTIGQNVTIQAVRAECAITNTAAASTLGGFLLFNASPVLNSTTASVAPYGCMTLLAQPTVSFDGTGTATLAASGLFTGASANIGVFDSPLIRNTSTGTFNADHTAFETIPRITRSAGTMTVSALRGLRVRPPTISGTVGITLHVGVDIEDIGIGSTTTANSLRSTGTSVTMRHAGSAIFGATSAPNVRMDIDGDFATRAANLALANGNNDNIAIGARSFIRVTGPTAAFAIRGIASGFDGKRVLIYNTTTQNMSINHEDAGSTAANRIRTNTGATVTTTGEGAVELIYDATQSRWILFDTAV